MLQRMTAQRDARKYPTLQFRISPEQKDKFDELLAAIQRDNPLIDAPTLARIFMGFETRIPFNPEWRKFLSGEINSLSGEQNDEPRIIFGNGPPPGLKKRK